MERSRTAAAALWHQVPVIVVALFLFLLSFYHMLHYPGPVWVKPMPWSVLAIHAVTLGGAIWMTWFVLGVARRVHFGEQFHALFTSGMVATLAALGMSALGEAVRPEVFASSFLKVLVEAPYPTWLIPIFAFCSAAFASAVREIGKMRYERDSLQVVLSLSETVSLMNVDQILQETVNCVRQLTAADAVLLFMLDEKADVLRVEAHYHNPAIYDEPYVTNMINFPCPRGYGLTGKVMETGEPLFSGDTSRDARSQRPPGQVAGGAKSTLLLPMKVKGRLIGVLRVTKQGVNQITQSQVTVSAILANHAAVALEAGGLYHSVLSASRTDSLTGLPNARSFREEMEQAVRMERHFALLMLDADALKLVNDSLGHQAGDQLLMDLAEAMKGVGQATGGLSFRYAGDEFMVILPGVTRQEAALVAERIRSGLAGTCMQGPQGPISCTVSVGVAGFPTDGTTVEEVLRAADRAMYLAKQDGKNRICLAS